LAAAGVRPRAPCLLPLFDSVDAGAAFFAAGFAGRVNLAIRCFSLPINFFSILLK
jgi:hypothetical protein